MKRSIVTLKASFSSIFVVISSLLFMLLIGAPSPRLVLSKRNVSFVAIPDLNKFKLQALCRFKGEEFLELGIVKKGQFSSLEVEERKDKNYTLELSDAIAKAKKKCRSFSVEDSNSYFSFVLSSSKKGKTTSIKFPSRLTQLVLPQELLTTHKVTLQALPRGERLNQVTFLLNKELIHRDRKAPFTALSGMRALFPLKTKGENHQICASGRMRDSSGQRSLKTTCLLISFEPASDASPTPTPLPTTIYETVSPSPSVSVPTPTIVPSLTTQTVTPTIVPTKQATSTPSPSPVTPTLTPTESPTSQPTAPVTPSSTSSAPTKTPTPVSTSTPSPTKQPTTIPTSTATVFVPFTPTSTPLPTIRPTLTVTSTPTATATSTLIPTATRTASPTPSFTPTSTGKTYFVSPVGSDTNPGSLNSPFKTMKRGVQVLQPGDTLVLRDGTYTRALSADNHVAWLSGAGLPNKWITIKAENEHKAILEGSKATSFGIVIDKNASYIKIEGLEIRGMTWGAIWANSDPGSHDIEIRRNLIHHNGTPVTACPDGLGRVGIFLNQHSTSYVIDSNTIYQNAREPNPSCDLLPTADNHNYRHDHGIYAQGRFHTIINNVFYDHPAGYHIKIDGYYGELDRTTQFTHVISNNTFGKNTNPDPNVMGTVIFFNNRTISSLYGEMKDPRALIQNNVFIEPKGAKSSYNTAIGIGPLPNSSSYGGHIFRNNITTSLYLYNENRTWVQGLSLTVNKNKLSTDPKVVNQVAYDFHLTAESPARDTGESQSAPAYDRDGYSRTLSVPDIGAYEWK